MSAKHAKWYRKHPEEDVLYEGEKIVCFGFGGRPNNADLVLRAVNSHDALLAACETTVNIPSNNYEIYQRNVIAAIKQAKAAIALAEKEGGK